MKTILRYAGVVNAAIWFGASLFFAVGVLPSVFSQEMRKLFGEAGFTYYAGAVALGLFRRYFVLQYVCAGFALAQLGAERFLSHKPAVRWHAIMLGTLLCAGLAGGFWMQPHMEKLRNEIYKSPVAEQSARARSSFGMWHGISEALDFLMLTAIAVHLVRTIQSSEPLANRTIYQIPG